jgi:hypothetical protein
MARTGENILSHSTGSIGNAVYYTMHGKNFVRSKPSKYTDRKSEAQLIQRAKMKAVTDFLSPFKDLVRITWAGEATGRAPYHAAKSELMRNALEGSYPDIRIKKEAALLSKGNLPLPGKVTVTIKDDGLLAEWTDGSEVSAKHGRDTFVVIALDKKTGNSEHKFTGIQRSAKSYMWKPGFEISQDNKPDLWIAFRSNNETEMSNSLYVKVG